MNEVNSLRGYILKEYIRYKSIYSYRVRIKYGVYTRTIIGVSSLQSLRSKPTGSGVVLRGSGV
nr:MAG TPA: hypothetical protein [Caudoviricetes sp.]